MKMISMEYDEYMEDLQNEYYSSKCCGISEVMHWLESGEKLIDFLDTIPDGDNIKPDSNWGRIAKALGREDELTYEKSSKM